MGVIWTTGEQQAVTDEGVRLLRDGKVKSQREALHRAQSVLPKARRRNISTTSKVPWFVAALKSAGRPEIGPQSAKGQQVATDIATAPANAAAGDSGRHGKVFWKTPEKQALCNEAARQMVDLLASGPRDALMKAQELVLSPERRRKIAAMSSLDDWYPDGLQKARVALVRKRVREAGEAEAKTKEEAAAPAAAADPAPSPNAVELVTPTTALAPAAPPPALATMFGDWTRIREHIVTEIANMVTEGIQRGLANVQLTPPAQKPEDTQTAAPARHVPFVVDPHPKERPPSVLVVGLKGAQVPQIEADFGKKLDLRFCSADNSKDQLRAMAEKADMTVAFVDFLSHSHTDIIKARSKRYIESAGGMTHLRQELARIAGMQLNGSGAAAHH
jgi:hypothetical protein